MNNLLSKIFNIKHKVFKVSINHIVVNLNRHGRQARARHQKHCPGDQGAQCTQLGSHHLQHLRQGRRHRPLKRRASWGEASEPCGRCDSQRQDSGPYHEGRLCHLL